LAPSDDQQVELVCSCGHRFVRKTGHLRGSPQFRCPVCGARVSASGYFPDPRLSVGDKDGEELRRRLRDTTR
jgi:DNA-directed RNA polymerase subunit RPC12/RpoP